jgi:hypothetical protein
MMQSTKHRDCNYLARLSLSALLVLRCLSIKTLMRPSDVIVAFKILRQQSPRVSLIEHGHMVKKFTAMTPKQPVGGEF